jgi:hypothetical protein
VKIDSECAADFRYSQGPRVRGRTAAHMSCCEESLAALTSLQMKAAEKGETLRPPHFSLPPDSTWTLAKSL